MKKMSRKIQTGIDIMAAGEIAEYTIMWLIKYYERHEPRAFTAIQTMKGALGHVGSIGDIIEDFPELFEEE